MSLDIEVSYYIGRNGDLKKHLLFLKITSLIFLLKVYNMF